MLSSKTILTILDSGEVERFHQQPRVTKQTIAQHSWRMSMLIQYFNPDCRKELILAALTHDCSEYVTGDSPATIKWHSPILKAELDSIEEKVEKDWGIQFGLTEPEKRLLKFCDVLEGMIYTTDRYESGERRAAFAYDQWNIFMEKTFGHMSGLQTTLLTKVRLRMSKLRGK